MTHTDLELKDFKDMEQTAIEQVRNGHKILITAGLILDYAEKMIKRLDGKTAQQEAEEQAEDHDRIKKHLNST